MDGLGEALLVEAEQGDAVRFAPEGQGVRHGGVDFRVVANDAVVAGILGAYDERLVFDGAKTVETPCVPGDGTGEFEFHDGFWGRDRRSVPL